ncbi:MAG: hypothetical protein ABIR54_16570 [Burkholderiaceae bacterium]
MDADVVNPGSAGAAKLLGVLAAFAIAASLLANGYFLWRHRGTSEVSPATLEVPIVVHVKGGLLEVSTLRGVETFQATTDETVLGLPIGKTVSRIRVPAVYRYHVELAPEWKILLKDKTFIVIAPAVKPSLPVAIDTSRLESESSGEWSLLTGTPRLAELQRSLTRSLAEKADSPAYVQLQRDVARQTLKEFVGKWLVTQERWKKASSYPIHEFFADEPIKALGTLPQPFLGSL